MHYCDYFINHQNPRPTREIIFNDILVFDLDKIKSCVKKNRRRLK